MMDMFKEQMAAKNQPQQPGVMEHPLFLKLFDKILEDSRGKPNEALQGVFQELSTMKEKLEHIGGGPGGLPQNPEQLHAYVDYMKTMNDIEKTRNEFTDKSETRKLIATVAQTALQSVGEAIAATYIQNPGTAQEQTIEVQEHPVDDGSVIQFQCPGCKAIISAPKDARAVQCPSGKTVMDKSGQAMGKEQLEKLQQEVLEERKAATKTPEIPPDPQLPPSPIPKPEAPESTAKADPKALGPVSLQMQEMRKSVSNKEESAVPPSSSPADAPPREMAETNLSSSDQSPEQQEHGGG
jgi:hypothetical protein